MNTSPLTEERTLCALEQYSFSDEAAQLILSEHPQLKMQYAKNIAGVWDAIFKHDALGIIPFENSSGGVVWPHLERLMRESQTLQIAAAVRLKVKLCAGGKEGMRLQDVLHVYSHPKGLEQAMGFLQQIPLPFQTVECASTVEGARLASEAPHSIALASRSALEAHDLSILADDIADLPGAQNVTKFFVVHKNKNDTLPKPEAEYHAAIITPRESRGVLADILQEIRSREVNLLSLHSRATSETQYAFYMEMQRQGSNHKMDLLNKSLSNSAFVKSIKWLGSWDAQFHN